jgi:hypothetical protein
LRIWIRVSSETSFVSYFAKHETKQVSCFAKQTCCFAKFRYEAKQPVSYVSLFFKRNGNAGFACFVTNFYQILSFIKKIVDLEGLGLLSQEFFSLNMVMMGIKRIFFRCRFQKIQVNLVTKCP